MAPSTIDGQLTVGAKILYKLNLKSPRRGTIREKERNRDKFSVEWEDGTTASVSLKAQQHDAWELIAHDAKLFASTSDHKTAPEVATDENALVDDKQHPPNRIAERENDLHMDKIPERKSEMEGNVVSEMKAGRVQKNKSKEQTNALASAKNPSLQEDAEAGDACDTSADTVEEVKEDASDSGKKKEKMERLARLQQRMGNLIGDKAPAASSDAKHVESSGEDKMDLEPRVSMARKEDPVSPEKDRSASDKKSKAQELIARLKARTESSVAALGAHSVSSGSEANRAASNSVLHKRTRPENPSDGFNASHHANRFRDSDDLVSLGAALLTETRGHLNGGSTYWSDAIKRARYDLDFDFDGSGSGSSVNAMKQFCGSRDLMKKERKNFPKETVDELKKWFEEHIMHPYPDDSDKDKLAEKTGLTTSQVSYWFVNARKRIWQPMLADRQQASLQGYAKVTAADVMLRGMCKKHSSGADWAETFKDFEFFTHAKKGFELYGSGAMGGTAEAAGSEGEGGGAALAELIAGQAPPGAPVPVARTSPANVDA